ncbi:uncharacterized protein B0T15DRAFT_403256 [Chaetomium strumarium]|uniref:Uncharacterized protein n=1 Tax=Chaetomium strumarium TaxID=1170767 RepID=A0AAJ0GLN9_9PEZI|nr:hypothetical protein B0T15DRAFT_403256 [Chaetomium strumarium]
MAQRRRRAAGQGVSEVGHMRTPTAPPAPFYDWASSDERRAFHFFQHVTAPCLSGDLDSAFWRVLVLQISQSEPAVKHAILAVSSLHESMIQAATMTPYLSSEDRSSFALYQYNRAIACLLDQMRTVDARPLVPLLTCVLFVCIEFMQSKDRPSLLHLTQGGQILSQLARKASTPNPEIDLIKQHLVPMYTRLSLTLLMFSGEAAAIPTPLKTLTEVPVVFETIDEVRYVLYDFMHECLRFAKKTHAAKIVEIPDEQLREFEDERDRLLRKLAKFNVAFSLYRSTRCRDPPAGSIALIQIHVHTTYIWVSTALSKHETVFDDFVDTFSAIIPLAKDFLDSFAPHPTNQGETAAPGPPTADTRRFSAMFTFDMHIIAPLYFVAAKCRHPIVRRAALDLLRRNPTRRENMWRADVWADIADRTMRLEEKHLRHTSSQQISRRPSPPELPALLPLSSSQSEVPWAASLSNALFPETFNSFGHGAPFGGTPFGSFDTAQAPVTSSGSSPSTTGSAADLASVGDLAGHMPIDPTLLFDPTEGSTAHSFSIAPSTASSIDDHGAPATASTPYIGTSTEEPTEPWDLGTSSQLPPGIALEPPTPLEDNPFAMPLPSNPRSQPHSRSHSRQPSLSRKAPSSMGSDRSPPLHRAEMDMRQRLAMHMPTFQPFSGLSLGQLSPTTGERSADAPFDVPERFRVHARPCANLGQGRTVSSGQARAGRFPQALRLPVIVEVGGEWDVQVIVDTSRQLYHAWGLGTGSYWYALNPLAMWHTWKLGTEEGIWNRNAESGSKWQIGGAYAVDAGGFVRWAKPAASADEVPDFKGALKALEGHWGMA